jgi:hypothetical protein
MMNIEDIDWHDQILSRIEIDRTNPGINDSIKLNVIIDGKEMIILFEDVYFAEFKMNFGVVAEESIKYAFLTNNDSEIANIKKKWINAEGELNKMVCFELNTNSTNSTIRIYCLSYSINM